MPLDEDRDDEPVGFGPPLPPEDRLWRHPSEVGIDRSTPGDRSRPSTTRPPVAPGGPAGARPAWGVLTAAGAAGAALALGVVAITGWWRPAVVGHQVAATARADQAAPGATSPTATPVGEMVERAGPSVAQVVINVGAGRRVGSGVVLGPAGYLVTSAALVGSATAARVSFADGTSFDGRVVSTDPVTALAVVHVESTTLRTPNVARAAPRVGDIAVALSGPADPSHTGLVTAGIVSGQGRLVTMSTGELHDMVETDRPVPEESDGGALVNGDGAVVGVCLRPSDQSNPSATAVGWAVPVDVAAKVATDVAMTGQAHHGWLGAEVADPPVPASLAVSLPATDDSQGRGPVVQSVVPSSPAAQAGLRSGDVLTAVDQQPINTRAGLITVMGGHRPGDRVTVTFTHGGAAHTTEVVLADRPVS